MSDLLTVEQARKMGFDEDALADLRAQGAIRADDTFARVETMDDVERLALKWLGYDAEKTRLKTQYERRIKTLAHRQKWIALQADDCAAVLAAHLPRIQKGKRAGEYAQKSHDFDEVRVKLVQKCGGLEVTEADFLACAVRAADGDETLADARMLCEAVRVERKETLEGIDAALLVGSLGWKASVLKTPIADYLAAHPGATLPGVSEVPVSQVFEIERTKGGTA